MSIEKSKYNNPCCGGCLDHTIPCPPKSNCGDCLKYCEIIIDKNDELAPAPCGVLGQFDLLSDRFVNNLCACSVEDVKFSVLNYDNNFVSAEINGSELSFRTAGSESVNKFGCITLEICCGQYTTYTNVYIQIKDLCICPNCNDCEVCDPCTGECIDSDVRLGLNSLQTQGNLIVNGN